MTSSKRRIPHERKLILRKASTTTKEMLKQVIDKTSRRTLSNKQKKLFLSVLIRLSKISNDETVVINHADKDGTWNCSNFFSRTLLKHSNTISIG